jgi:hypothetical protein
MNQKYVLVGCGLGCDKVVGFGDSGLNQPLVDALVFFGREDVCPDGEIIVIAVNKLEWEHG